MTNQKMNNQEEKALKSISSPEIQEITEKMAEIISSNYVYPDIGDNIADKFREVLQTSSIAHVKTYHDYAKFVQSSMEEIVVDKHNRVLARGGGGDKYFELADMYPEGGSQVIKTKESDQEIGQPKMMRRMVKPGADSSDDGPVRVVRRIAGGPAGDPQKFVTGINDHKILDGNIGYLNLSMFSSVESPDGEKMINILQGFTHTKAIIVDLRECRGGDGSMVELIQNFIFGYEEGDERIQTMEIYFRPSDTTIERYPEPWEHGDSYKGKPVYVLTSNKTGSAAEGFSFGLRNSKRATIIGGVTAGAGHPTSFHRLHPEILFMCSVGRAYDPKTNKGFEKIGVEPNIIVDQEIALDRALELIKKL